MVSRRQQELYATHIRQLIAEHGWAVQGVLHTATEPPFSYTVGLTGAGLPELIVVGVSHQVGVTMLNKLAQQSLAEEWEVGRRVRPLPRRPRTDFPYRAGVTRERSQVPSGRRASLRPASGQGIPGLLAIRA